jgi:hypothetical protein
MSRIGEYFSPGGSSELSGATDPIILSCQKNWHMLFTDGFTNQGSLPTSTVADQDDKVPTTGPMGQLPVNGLTPVTITGLTPGSAWPPPFREDPNASASNAASDYSMNYWVTDLRPAMPMNVATSTKDPAPWPHLNFAAMSLGTQGILPSGNQSVVESQLTAGTLLWPKPQPTVYKPDQSGVDDLWHAAMNGRGRFVNAQSADELKLGMGQILQDVINQAGARAGVGFQSANVSGANNNVYRVRFEPGWGASLTKIQIDPTTGAEVANIWEASTQLTAQLAVVNPGDTPWFTNRKIVTVDESKNPVPFLWASIGANELDSLSPGKTARAKLVLEFLRGNRPTKAARSASSASASAACSATSSTRRRSMSARRVRRIWTPTTRATRDVEDRLGAVGRAFTSAPTMACCMFSTTPPATKPGRSCRRSSSVPTRPAWAPFRTRMERCRRSSIISMSIRRRESPTSASAAALRLAHAAGRRPRQGRPHLLRAGCIGSRQHHRRDHGGAEGAVAIHRCRHGLQLRAADHRQDPCVRRQ